MRLANAQVDLLSADRADECVKWIRNKHWHQSRVERRETGNGTIALRKLRQRQRLRDEGRLDQTAGSRRRALRKAGVQAVSRVHLES